MKRFDLGNRVAVLETPELYVDNKSRNRSGHMSHAMTEFQKGKFIDFNSNCSPVRAAGHAAYGFIEYRISEDNGKTYSTPQVLKYSKDSLDDGVVTISVEKAVTCKDGSILALCLRNTTFQEVCCEPWLTPTAVRSRDGGKTWEEPFEISSYEGRIYDAITVDGKIYFLQFKSEVFLGEKPEHKYSVFTSDDDGKSFYELAELPIDGMAHGYGSLLFDGKLMHAYGYNAEDERHLDHAISADLGKTWTLCEPCYLDHAIRNPQTALLDGVYVMHGRMEKSTGFVFYFSEDGSNWSKGFIAGEVQGGCYYSNNLLLEENGSNFLLIQYSEIYESKKVNIYHTRLHIENK